MPLVFKRTTPQPVVDANTLFHGQPATFNGFNFGPKSRGLAPILDDSGQAGVGVVDSQWDGGARMATVDSYSPYNILNQPTNFNPTGANIGPPHPYLSAFLGGGHYGDVNADAPWSVYVSKQITIPAPGPSVFYACWYERQDPNSALNLGHGAGANLKMFGVSSIAGGIVADTYVFVMLPGSFNNTDLGYSCILAQNGTTLEIVSNLFGGLELNPYNASNGWKFVEVEITLDSRLLAAGGQGTIQRYVNGVKMFSSPYLGRTDPGVGTTRYVTIGGGVFTNDYGDATHTPTAIKNWSYLADAKFDITGTGVTGSCARLYLTNASTLAASTLRAYQVPDVWTNSQIHVPAIRKGPLPGGSNVWAQVVPEAGLGSAVAVGPFTMAVSP